MEEYLNAHSRTPHDIASETSHRVRSEQAVHVCSSVFSGSPLGPRHVVLVIPAYRNRGTEYECRDRDLALLRSGMTPEDLELEPFEDDEDERADAGESPESLLRWYRGRVL